MKVFNLSCSAQHVFEGWFASEEDFQSQLDRGLVACPLCGNAQVVKRPSAPHLNLGSQAPRPTVPAATEFTLDASTSALQSRLVRAMREVIAHTEDVGARFAEQARAMHEGQVEAKPIRGRTSLAEAQALLDDGVDVWPLPNLPGLKEPLQ